VKWEWRKRVKKKILKIGGLVRKDPFFETPKIGCFKNYLFSPKNFMIFFPPKGERKKQIWKKLPKNI